MSSMLGLLQLARTAVRPEQKRFFNKLLFEEYLKVIQNEESPAFA